MGRVSKDAGRSVQPSEKFSPQLEQRAQAATLTAIGGSPLSIRR